MSLIRSITCSVALGALIYSNTAMAAAVDCDKVLNRDCRRDVTMDPKDVVQCMERGYDPPLKCRADEGKGMVTVGGSSGFSYGTVQAPQNSPGAMGANPSVGASTIQRSFGFPPWPGFPCKLPGGYDLCASGVTPLPTPNPNDPCPAKNDVSGLYGAKQPVTGGTALSLPCGGALPLTSYQTTLNKNPDRLAVTEYSTNPTYDPFYIRFYEKSGNTYKLKPASAQEAAWALPKFLCKDAPLDANGKPMVIMKLDPQTNDPFHQTERDKTVDLTPPIAQMIAFSPSDTSITLRLRSRNKPLSTKPEDMSKHGQMKPKYNPDDPEKYLIIPIVGGVPKIPPRCSEDKDYYKEISSSRADIVIESAVLDECEGTPAVCAGQSTVPAPEETCDVVSIGLNASNAPTGCVGKTQLMVLDRPNLLYPPGTNVTPLPIEGLANANPPEPPRTAVMAPSTEKSKIFMQTDTIIRLGKTAPPITLTEGGILAMKDGTTLVMDAPATVDAAAGKVILTSGGKLKAESGSLIKQVTGTYTPVNPVLPFTINVKRSMDMPVGYELPTQIKPYAQLPIPKP